MPVTLTPSVSGGQLTEHAQLHGRPCFPECKPQLPCSSPSPCTALPQRRRTACALCWLLSRTTVAQVVGAARIGGSRLSPLCSPLCKPHDLPATPQWPFRLFASLAVTSKAPPHAAARLWMRTNAPFCRGQTQGGAPHSFPRRLCWFTHHRHWALPHFSLAVPLLGCVLVHCH